MPARLVSRLRSFISTASSYVALVIHIAELTIRRKIRCSTRDIETLLHQMKPSRADGVEFCRVSEDVVHDKAAEEEIKEECGQVV